MQRKRFQAKASIACSLVVLLAPLVMATPVAAQKKNPRLELYGFVQADVIHDFNQVNPDWFDVLRPTKLPRFHDEFGEDGHEWFSVRQTRFGAKAWFPTDLGELYTIFEWELFGVGVDAGQTTFRLRHAYGEIGKFGAGQTWSPFMDIDVFPNSLEYWGPNGMVFFRNIQFRYMPIKGDSRVTFAIERPGASGDAGRFQDRIELQNIVGRFPYPDLSAEGRLARNWGYLELAGILRYIRWDDLIEDDPFLLSGDGLGWGLTLSSNLKFSKKATFKWQVVVGKGIENYMNDAPVDVAPELNLISPVRPIVGELLPMWSMTAFFDINWSKKFSTAIGYSRLNIDNTTGQLPDDFHAGQYSLANLLYYPTTNIMVGGELQWGHRSNAFDDFTAHDWRFQTSARFNYGLKFWNEVSTSDK